MNFAEDRRPHGLGPEHRWLRRGLFLACAITVASTAWPWLRVHLVRGLDDLGFRTRTGSVCVLSCVLIAMLATLETKSRHTREAVRPAAAFVAAVTAAVVAMDGWNGPGRLYGRPVEWTSWFWLGFAGVVAATIACLLRLPRRAPRSL